MQVETEINGQGMRREEAQIEVRKLHSQDEELVRPEEPKGILGSLWGSVKAATAAVTHMAHDAAVAAEHTGEKIVEQTKEIVLELEHQAEAGVSLAVHTAVDLGSDLQTKAHDATVQVQHKGEELLEQAKPTLDSLAAQAQVVGQQAIVKGEELYEQAKPTIDSLAGQAIELGHQAVVKGEVLFEQAKPTLDSLAAQAQVVGQQAVSKGEELYVQAKPTIDNLYEQAKPTLDIMYEQTKPALDKAKELGQELYEQAKPTLDTLAAQAQVVGQQAAVKGEELAAQAQTSLGLPLSRSASKKQLKKSASGKSIESEQWNGEPLVLTMDVVSHIQRIADRTGDAVLHETARKAHSACAKGLSEAPGVHLVWITPSQANDLVNLAIRTQDHELADFARYCQSVAATTHVGVEPSPGKIQQEIQKGHEELQQQGRVHTGPGYGAAFASVNKTYAAVGSSTPTSVPQATEQVQKAVQPDAAPPKLELTMDVVSHIQRIADRTSNEVLHETARKAHSACAKGLSDAPGVHLVWIAPQQASELMNLASKTQDAELIDFARYCQSVAATTQVGVEPAPGKIQAEILKGRQDLQKMVRQLSLESVPLLKKEKDALLREKEGEVRTEPVNVSAASAAL